MAFISKVVDGIEILQELQPILQRYQTRFTSKVTQIRELYGKLALFGKIAIFPAIALLIVTAIFASVYSPEKVRTRNKIRSRVGPFTKFDIVDALLASSGRVPARLFMGPRSALLSWLEAQAPIDDFENDFSKASASALGSMEPKVEVKPGLVTRLEWVTMYPNVLEIALSDERGERRDLKVTYQMVQACPILLGVS